jgi:hypothetical protein
MRLKLIVLLTTVCLTAEGWGQATWKIDTLDQSGLNIESIAYGGGKFVAADVKAIYVSSNGANWSAVTPPAANYFGCQSITYAAGEFFALGYLQNTPKTKELAVFTSADGVTWSARITTQWATAAIGFGGGTYIALGTYDTIGVGHTNYDLIKSSTDGVTWVTRDSGRTRLLDGIAYGSNLFVAVGQHGSILTSPDGTVWTIRTLPGSDTTSLFGISYGNGKFVIVGNNPHKAYYSTNGINWATSTPPASVAYLTSITYGAGQFVAAGQDSSQHTLFLTSPDGIAWTLRLSGLQRGAPICITYGNGYFVAGCYTTGIYSVVMSSSAISSVSNFPFSNDLELGKMQVSGSTLYYNLPAASNAMLSICDLRGKNIAMLRNSWQASGRHGVALPAGIASGSYIVSLRAGGYSIDRKIMMEK